MENSGLYNFIFKKISCGVGCIFSYIDYKELFLFGIFLALCFIIYQLGRIHRCVKGKDGEQHV